MGRLEDGFGRRFRYLRLSVTEVCNFRCGYCLPDGWKAEGPLSFLSADEIGRLVRGFARLGVTKVRLTGGEPSVRKDLTEIIARVSSTPGVDTVALTTNGWNLARRAAEWRAAGLTHVNLSVDALDRETFWKVTGKDRYDDVMAGLDTALASGFRSVKLNAVLLKDTVADGFDAFADLVRRTPVSARFIELMRTADNAGYFADQHVGGAVLRAWLEARGWRPTERAADAGPAVEFARPDFVGRFGLIAPYGPGFCDSCNRLRVTARGRLRLCLFGEGGADLRDLLAEDGREAELQDRVTTALSGKAAGHRLHEGRFGDTRRLADVGG
jgi:cyclic pyranopterin phosphate synthase